MYLVFGSSGIFGVLRFLSVARLVSLSFALVIFIGSVLLYFVADGNLSYIDSLYLSASAICVTGLTPVPISTLGFDVQLIIMVLIQLGGLGIITFTVVIGFLIIKGLSRNSRMASFVSEAIDSHEDEFERKKSRQETKSEVNRILFSIINLTIFIEGIGAVLLFTSSERRCFSMVFGSVYIYFCF